jgi:hypothetical protein
MAGDGESHDVACANIPSIYIAVQLAYKLMMAMAGTRITFKNEAFSMLEWS